MKFSSIKDLQSDDSPALGCKTTWSPHERLDEAGLLEIYINKKKYSNPRGKHLGASFLS